MICPDNHPHTRHCYDVHKCRCDDCRAANYRHVTARRSKNTRRHVPETIRERPTKKCSRCGLEREARKDTTLCRDCRDVLTSEERKAWAA